MAPTRIREKEKDMRFISRFPSHFHCLCGQLSSFGFECAAVQHNPVTAGQTFQTNIRAQPHHLPFITTAGVSLAQAHNITEFKVL